MKKIAVIQNPAAGRGRGAKTGPLIVRNLEAMGFRPQVYITRQAGETGVLAMKAQEAGADILVLVGGDGTLHEVVNKIYFNKSRLVIIPAGTGNDFARSAGLPKDPIAALQVLHDGPTAYVDVGKVNGRFFINGAGVGFDAEVAHAVNNGFRMGGRSAYLAAVLRKIITYRNIPVEITVDGHTILDTVFFVAVGNGSFVGGGMKVNPEAQLDDGALDLCIAGNVSRLEVLKTLPKIFSGNHVHHPLVTCLKAKEITVKSPYPLCVHADGEIIGRAPAVFSVIPRALQVLVPRPVRSIEER